MGIINEMKAISYIKNDLKLGYALYMHTALFFIVLGDLCIISYRLYRESFCFTANIFV